MRKYWAVAQAAWQEYVAYRLNLLLEILGNALLMLATIAVWRAVFESRPDGVVGDFAYPEMITYLLVAGLINSFIWLTAQGDEINDDINQGKLSVWLHRPIHAIGYWFARDVVRKGMTLVLGAAVFLVIVAVYRADLVLPSLMNVLLFLVSVLLAGLLHFLIFALFSIIAFWFEQTWGERFIIRVVIEIAAGALIPLSLFPPVWQVVFAWLPFKFLIAFPAELFLGRITGAELIGGFLVLTLWIGLFALATAFVWKRGLQRYTAEGG